MVIYKSSILNGYVPDTSEIVAKYSVLDSFVLLDIMKKKGEHHFVISILTATSKRGIKYKKEKSSKWQYLFG